MYSKNGIQGRIITINRLTNVNRGQKINLCELCQMAFKTLNFPDYNVYEIFGG